MTLKIIKKKKIDENNNQNYVLFTDENFILRNFNNTKISKKISELNKTIKSFKKTHSNILSLNNSNQKFIFIRNRKIRS